MSCPLCRQRKARRACPALGQTICPVCCATKRLVEIDCPDSCGYLTAARQHPAAAVLRQHDHDFGLLIPTIRDLSEPQQQLFFLLVTTVLGLPEDPLQRMCDDDVAEAAAALAGTFETAARGVIYEQQPQARIARDLVSGFQSLLRAVGAEITPRQLERDASFALRALERGAREVRAATGGGDRAYVDLLRRTLPAVRKRSVSLEDAAEAPGGAARPLIVPPFEA